MKNKLGWILAALFGVLLIIFAAGVLIVGRMWRFGDHMRPFGMMGRGFGFYAPFGWIGMALLWLIPIGFLVLIVAGIVSLVSALTGSKKSSAATSQAIPTSTTPPPPSGTISMNVGAVSPAPQEQENLRTCQNCGKPVQADWSHCPYCGQELS